MSLCPCGSQNTYALCCGLYLEQGQTPQTPEQLMRSRYTAYSLAKIEYIKTTMAGNALLSFNEADAYDWAKSVIWAGLEVIQAYLETSEKGFVEFSARFIERNQLKALHEVSEFHKKNNTWLYVDGTNRELIHSKQKISRNAPCPCGSGKKFKNCHYQ